MDAVEFLKESKRMCKGFTDCCLCPFNEIGVCGIADIFSIENEEDTVSHVEQWSKEHPKETRQSKLLKMYPNAKMTEYGVIVICPKDIDNKDDCDCIKTCSLCREEYWLSEIE